MRSKLKAIWAIIRGDAVIFNVAFLTHISMLPKNPGQSLFVYNCEFKGESKLYGVKLPENITEIRQS